ncbi:MAG: type II secretion system protein [Phycisphaerales bacterium]
MNAALPNVARAPAHRPALLRARMSARTPRRARRAFSLIELVIVIGIIVLLAGLVLAVGTGLLTQSDERQTRAAMQLVDAAIEEWQLASGRQFSYGKNGVPAGATYDFQDTLADNATMVELLRAVGGPEQCRATLGRVDQNLLRSTPGAGGPNAAPDREFVDAWGARVIAVFPGRAWLPADGNANKDADGTFRTAQEKRLGVCRNRKILLVSVGPDGQAGDLSGSDDAKKLAADNVYSYEGDKP